MSKREKRTIQRSTRDSKEFEQKIIDLARVMRVMAGGKRLRFRACVAIGDGKGRVGVAIGKGADVAIAVEKAVTKAKKRLITIPIKNKTIPHEVRVKFGAAKILLKPAPAGTGIKAGGIIRLILGLGGVPNIVAKILGSNNKINNAQALMIALEKFVIPKEKRNTPKKKEVSKDKGKK